MIISVIPLPRPDELSDEHWAAITYGSDRMAQCVVGSDWPSAVGAAKNLCESVAKVVLARRPMAQEVREYPQLIGAAHRALDRRPGYGAAAEQPTRDMAAGARQLVTALGELRNRVGDGHGGVEVPAATVEHAGLAVDAALLWCRWALSRLDFVLANSVDRLVSSLDGGEVFRSGEMAERLRGLGMADLSNDELFRLGRAVAHRGVHRRTFVVMEEGIGAALVEPTLFPEPYRRGLLSGIFVDTNGYVRSTPESLQLAQHLANSLQDTTFMSELAQAVEGADFSYATDLKTVMALAQVIDAFARSLEDGALRSAWTRISAKFRIAEA